MALPVYPQYSVGGDAPVAPTAVAPQPTALPFGIQPTSASSSTSSTTGVGTVTPILPTSPYPDRVLPSWLPKSADAITGELSDQYNKVGDAYNTAAVDAAAANQQSEDLTSGLKAANNAASEYATRTMQQGGSAAGAGLIRAEGQVGAVNAAGAAKVEAAKYDVAQREAAAGQAAQIASTLSDLRSGYLKTLTGYAATEDATATGSSSSQSESAANQAVSGTTPTSGGGLGVTHAGVTPNSSGLASGLDAIDHSSVGGVSRPPSSSGATNSDWLPPY
jgi:hypothetical protein